MNKPEILIIDDEPQIRKLLQITLESNEYKIIQASTGIEGIHMAANRAPDLIILDLGLPDKEGQEILKELRQWFEKPIIILSVQNGEQDIVQALDTGATDYLAKPFRTGELMARIRSSLRVNQTSKASPVVNSGLLEIDLSTRNVLKNQQLVKMTCTEYNILALFAKNQGKVLTHQYILREIWGIGAQKETQYLRVFVAQIRKKIEDNPNSPQHIITQSGVGYRFA